jgi:hypothetical protein
MNLAAHLHSRLGAAAARWIYWLLDPLLLLLLLQTGRAPDRQEELWRMRVRLHHLARR